MPKRPPNKVPLWERPTFLYRTYDVNGVLIYVGISDNWRTRLEGHRKNSCWWKYVWHVTVEEHVDRHAAFAAESWDIRYWVPAMNSEEQRKHVPLDRPLPVVSFSRRVRRYKFNGDEIEPEALP